ncbi:MAG: UDP-N-acetylmuramate dehydrogenase [Sedimentisphaerales bacterium]|nr:UDP-N-acetylmuramate dehydrogenase [Sedimentisphaerales bacterium]
MNLFAGLEEIVKFDEPLAPYNWFKLGGPARYFVTPRNLDQLKQVIERCNENHVDVKILGRGSNLLVGDEGVDGVVIRMTDKYFGQISIEGNTVCAGAGASINRLLQVCARAGLSGMECLVGIPGSVGGAVKINAGGRFGDIGSFSHSVSLMDSSGYQFVRPREDIYFGYRETNIMAKLILSAEFTLTPDDPEAIGRTIKEVWMLKKISQPMSSRNAGCVFKNPRALSAGALIDQAGLKGLRLGGAQVSERHANFIVVSDGATASDVLKLIDQIRQQVQRRFDVELELELEIWR